jgi:hypothetical protein
VCKAHQRKKEKNGEWEEQSPAENKSKARRLMWINHMINLVKDVIERDL